MISEDDSVKIASGFILSNTRAFLQVLRFPPVVTNTSTLLVEQFENN